jgi:hypothetical protein
MKDRRMQILHALNEKFECDFCGKEINGCFIGKNGEYVCGECCDYGNDKSKLKKVEI